MKRKVKKKKNFAYSYYEIFVVRNSLRGHSLIVCFQQIFQKRLDFVSLHVPILVTIIVIPDLQGKKKGKEKQQNKYSTN